MILISDIKRGGFGKKGFLFWYLLVLFTQVFSLCQSNSWFGYIFTAVLCLMPIRLNSLPRLFLIFSLAIGIFIDPICPFIISFLWLIFLGKGSYAIFLFLSYYLAKTVLPFFQNIPDYSAFPIPIASFFFLILPTASVLFFLILHRNWKACFNLLTSFIFCCLILELLGFSGILPVNLFVSEYFRFFMGGLLLFVFFIRYTPDLESHSLPDFHLSWFQTTVLTVAGFLVFVIGFFLPQNPIDQVFWDESHGKWETVLNDFNEKSFGRGEYYTYSVLYRKTGIIYDVKTFSTEGESLPSHKTGVFILKTPVLGASESFISKLEKWVHDGGRLLIIGDHTDLYDSTQNINEILSAFTTANLRIDSSYNFKGYPTKTESSFINRLVGTIEPNNSKFSWLTAATINEFPLLASEILGAEVSFSEEGDYSRPHRFGPFIPKLSDRYIPHTVSFMFPHGEGAVALFLDSTPWSNFSIFKKEYQDVFFNLMKALEMQTAIFIKPWIALLLWFCMGLIIYFPKEKYLYLGSFLLLIFVFGIGLSISCFSQNQTVTNNSNLLVWTGHSAKTEFLNELLSPGENNYSRLISSQSKYHLEPLLFNTNNADAYIRSNKNKFLFIEPDPNQLPSGSKILEAIKYGSNVTVLFENSQVYDKKILHWLGSLGLICKPQKVIASTQNVLSKLPWLTESPLLLTPHTRIIVEAKPTSLLKLKSKDYLLSRFEHRGNPFAGSLNVGFCANDFSDAIIGDVWEGSTPSVYGVRAEKYIASIMTGEAPDVSVQTQYHKVIKPNSKGFKSVGIWRNGELELLKTVEDVYKDPILYTNLSQLQTALSAFVLDSCSRGVCKTKFLDPWLNEWTVVYKQNTDEKVLMIEAIYSKTHGSLDANFNIVFSF